MANKFSAVLLGDLNDFISPGQACINPIFVESAKPDKEKEGGAEQTTTGTKKKATIELVFDDVPSVTKTKGLIRQDKTTKAAKVSLSDCLACSGCVTSAETVLLKAQSVQEFLTTMAAIREGSHATFKVAAVTISPQVRASLAVRFNISPLEAYGKIATFLKARLGVRYVLDCGALPSDISQFIVAQDFVERYRQSKMNPNLPSSLPLLSSNCPGWVCYAEKTHAHALPYLSETKSPQQVAGSILKRHLHSQHGLEANEVYHVSIMQCPDKKLEASRNDYWLGPDEKFGEVNCVLTATELMDTIIETFQAPDLDLAFQALENNLEMICSNDLERTFRPLTTSEEPNAGGSGGLCGFVFRYAAKELFQVEIPSTTPLPFKPGRNPDTWTLDLAIDGNLVLRFAASYGFRNIQETVRKLKNGTAPWHFVEVMACPGGCTNGGGLLIPQSESGVVAASNASNSIKRALAEKVARTMEQVPRSMVGDNPAMSEVLINRSALKATFNAVKDIFNTVPDPGLLQTW